MYKSNVKGNHLGLPDLTVSSLDFAKLNNSKEITLNTKSLVFPVPKNVTVIQLLYCQKLINMSGPLK